MSSGIKRSGDRPKTSKHLRASKGKKFRNDSPEAREKYAEKLKRRRDRKKAKKR